MVTTVTLAIREHGSKNAQFLHSARTVQAQRTVCPLRKSWMEGGGG